MNHNYLCLLHASRTRPRGEGFAAALGLLALSLAGCGHPAADVVGDPNQVSNEPSGAAGQTDTTTSFDASPGQGGGGSQGSAPEASTMIVNDRGPTPPRDGAMFPFP